jgi:hypothetical protein
MDREDIIRMAGGAGFASPDGSFITWDASDEQLERFAALVAAAEREACAKVCDGMDHNGVMIAADCAAAIRARGNK